MRIAFFGSSLVSSYWNGAATYYRGLLKALAARGHDVSFYEPDAFDRQQHRDITDPDWAKVIVYPATNEGWQSSLATAARQSDLLVKASGVGVFDMELEQAVPDAVPSSALCVYWDVDAPATLEAIGAKPDHHLHRAIPRYDAVLTYGGGDPVISAYQHIGARICLPIYNALDPDVHHPVPPRSNFVCDLGFLGNRLPDREGRVEEFFLRAAALLPECRFLLGGSGWRDKAMPPNVRAIGHVGTNEHNAFFCSGRATLNINRDSMARYGFSPPTRVFEAAGAGTCLISDCWQGIELFLEPGREILIANDGNDVADAIAALSTANAQRMANAARRRILAHHTYGNRAAQVDCFLNGIALKGEAAE
jgi:spore maturation protein CgeB